jgi:hypothetical protein
MFGIKGYDENEGIGGSVRPLLLPKKSPINEIILI